MWPEIEKAKQENRHEIVLCGNEIDKRIQENGLDSTVFSLNLNFLDIHETSLKQISNDIKQLVNLQTLVLHSNKLEEINENIFKLEKLKFLDLSRNVITKFPNNCLEHLPNLSTLNLSGNCLQEFPEISHNYKLTVLDLSKNNLKLFPNICHKQMVNLSELNLSENQIEVIPAQITQLTSLKSLDLNNNKVKDVPADLALCLKLKVLNIKGNPLCDRRLLKLVDQCRTIKQLIDYIKQHCQKTIAIPEDNKTKTKIKIEEKEEDVKQFKYTINVQQQQQQTNEQDLKVIITDNVKGIREYFFSCIIINLSFNEEKFKKFIQLQNKLHDTICGKRTLSTIATHDLEKLIPGNLTYTTLPPSELILKPLNYTNDITGLELFNKLQLEANNLRKERKRNTYSGIHKYLNLIEGQLQYPCLINGQNQVISFPPITNSEITKISLNTNKIFIEVTSSVSQQICKQTLDSLLKEMVLLFEQDLNVIQVRTFDNLGNLKTTYPSKTDLKFVKNSNINVKF